VVIGWFPCASSEGASAKFAVWEPA
jgi:hypothetical protein